MFQTKIGNNGNYVFIYIHLIRNNIDFSRVKENEQRGISEQREPS